MFALLIFPGRPTYRPCVKNMPAACLQQGMRLALGYFCRGKATTKMDLNPSPKGTPQLFTIHFSLLDNPSVSSLA